jgi:hypothetical protein
VKNASRIRTAIRSDAKDYPRSPPKHEKEKALMN